MRDLVEEKELIDETIALCNDCLKAVPTLVVNREGRAYFIKNCPDCGQTSAKVSNHGWFYAGLRRFYFTVTKKTFAQKRFLLFFCPDCNLACPVCYLKPYDKTINKLSLEEIERIAKQKIGELVLYGAEPTCAGEIFEVIKLIKKYQKNIILYTNGLKLDDYAYALKLKDAGITKIALQFDGFNDTSDRIMRGRKVLPQKLVCLENLKKLNMPVVLDVTVMKGVNEDQCAEIVEYARKNDFIRGITWLPFTSTRRCGDGLESRQLIADDVIDIVEKHEQSGVRRQDLFVFQKLLYVIMAALKQRVCLHAYHGWFFRDRGTLLGLGEIWDVRKLDEYLEKFVRLAEQGSGFRKWWYLILGIIVAAKKKTALRQIFRATRDLFLMIFGRIDPHCADRNLLHMVFETGCAPPLMDVRVVDKCVSGWIFKGRDGVLQISDDCRSMLNKLWEK